MIFGDCDVHHARSRILIYDVGLHHGEDTAYYLRKGYRVVAFEAHPGLVANCRARFAEEIADGRLKIIEGAIAGEPMKPVRFYPHPTNSEWGTTSPDWDKRNAGDGDAQAIVVPAVDFASILRVYGVPHYMKVDIEGGRSPVLRTARVCSTSTEVRLA